MAFLWCACLMRVTLTKVVQSSVPVAVVKVAFSLEKGELSDVVTWEHRIDWWKISEQQSQGCLRNWRALGPANRLSRSPMGGNST